MPGMATLLPDYAGGSILNLAASIAAACGAPERIYAPARLLGPEELAEAEHVVLLVIDGLGRDTLERLGTGGALAGHCRGTLTSVFPSTTASAVTTFLTGLAPQQHGLTGWHMYFAEIERILAVLPLTPRGGSALAEAATDLPPRLAMGASLAARLRRPAWVVTPASIAGSAFNGFHTRGATVLPYAKRPAEMFERVAEALAAGGGPKFVHAYYPSLDASAHRHGIASARVAEVFRELDEAFGAFLERIAGLDALVVATADHGFIDAPAERSIPLEAHPRLAETLARPLCGERRIAYCYVKPDRRSEFEAYVHGELAEAAQLHASADLVAQGWFGPGEPHPRLYERIGDYTLVMRDDWTIVDWLPDEKRYVQVGVHAGVSRAEMEVPLVVARGG